MANEYLAQRQQEKTEKLKTLLAQKKDRPPFFPQTPVTMTSEASSDQKLVAPKPLRPTGRIKIQF